MQMYIYENASVFVKYAMSITDRTYMNSKLLSSLIECLEDCSAQSKEM